MDFDSKIRTVLATKTFRYCSMFIEMTANARMRPKSTASEIFIANPKLNDNKLSGTR